MLRGTALTSLVLVLLGLVSTYTAKLLQTGPSIRQLTFTSETALNLNPTLSNDGSTVFFESTVDLTQADAPTGFNCVKTHLDSSSAFAQIAAGRCVAPASAANGAMIAFSSTEDLVGRNPDRNSEIFTFSDVGLAQLTMTKPASESTRLSDGNIQPSISSDGKFIVFSSNRDLVGQNSDHNSEIFLYEKDYLSFSQLTTTVAPAKCSHPQISGNGQTIIYIQADEFDESQSDLRFYDRSTSQGRPLVTRVRALSLSASRAISNDGLRIVYSAETASNQTQVFLLDVGDNSPEQLTNLPSRTSDVDLNPTISGDGKRVAFATRRRVLGQNDGSTELYVYDIPSSSVQQVTDAPSKATGEVLSSLNFDGSLVAFSFPRVLTESVTDSDFGNNSEIYVANVKARPAFGEASVFNAANVDTRSSDVIGTVAPDSIVSLRGTALSHKTAESLFDNQQLPSSLAGTSVTINGVTAKLFYVSPTEIIFAMPEGLGEGPAEVLSANPDGFVSRADVTLQRAAPGIFTFAGDGQGGVVMDASNFTTSPLDPTDGHLRLVAFSTGVRNARSVSVRINGNAHAAEQVLPSSVPGLDEVHFLIPDSLRGAGVVALQIIGDEIVSNSVRIKLGGSSVRDIMINEFLADPPDGLAGDANYDGVRSASADEFIELVNTTSQDINIGSYKLLTRATNGNTTLRHLFPADTILSAGTAAVVFGGGTLDPGNEAFAKSLVMKASTGSLSLTNSGGSIILQNKDGVELTSVTYGPDTSIDAGNNQSVTRAPDITGALASHSLIAESGGRPFSPGTRVDGTPFLPEPPVSKVQLFLPGNELHIGDKVQVSAIALDAQDQQIPGVLFSWSSSAPDVMTVDAHGQATALTPGVVRLTATARGVSSLTAEIKVSSQLPSPTPTPLASPTPHPSPLIIPQLLISEFRTRGPNGANDEFVEIYNASSSAIDISGFKIKASNTNGSVGTRLSINQNTVIQSHGHFLATNSIGYSGSIAGDQSFSSGITNDGGLALTLPDDSVIDQVGLSGGSAFKEGSALAPLASDADQSYERKPGGQNGNGNDSQNNADDFNLSIPPNPQNLNSPPTPSSNPLPSPTASPTPVPSPTSTPTPDATQVVISQVFGGGGNTGAPFQTDFIELFNSGSESVDLSGWSIQYSGASSTTWSVTPLTSLSLSPGQHYLVQEGSGGVAGVPLPRADTSGAISMSATAGKVALVKSVIALAGVCPSQSTILDMVGYGAAASCFNGSGPTTAPGNATAVIRKQDGCANDRNNAGDFEVGTPVPRNSSSPISACHSTAQAKSLYRISLSGWWMSLSSADSSEYFSPLLMWQLIANQKISVSA